MERERATDKVRVGWRESERGSERETEREGRAILWRAREREREREREERHEEDEDGSDGEKNGKERQTWRSKER